MPYLTNKEKYNKLLQKIKQYPIYSLVIFILIIGFLIFSYIHPLKETYPSRTILPKIETPTGTFSLIKEPEDGTNTILNMIKNSTNSIDLVMYELTDKEIADALVESVGRGVKVRVLLNQGYFGKQENKNISAYNYLANRGVSTHWTPSYFALTHQKTLLIDGTQALIMTFNLVPKYYPTGRDFGIIDNNKNDVQAIEKTFDADWNNEKIATQNGDDLVWSPGSDSDMLLIINNAKRELDIYNEELADDRIVNALTQAERRGVEVKIIMTYATNWKPAFNELKSSGAELHLFHGQKGLYIHAKMIIADQGYAFIGSENFSYGSLNQNRELGIFLSDTAIINSLINTFSEDWKNAKPYQVS